MRVTNLIKAVQSLYNTSDGYSKLVWIQQGHVVTPTFFYHGSLQRYYTREGSGSVVECLT